MDELATTQAPSGFDAIVQSSAMESTEEKTGNALGLGVVKNQVYTNNLTLFNAAMAARPPSGGSVSRCPRSGSAL